MSWFTKLFTPPETKASRAMSVVHRELPPVEWSKREYISFCKEAYQQNVVAYQAVNRLANSVAAVEWEVWQGDKQLDKSPLLDLLARPNSAQSGKDWWRSRITYLYLAGAEYCEAVEGPGRRLMELWPLRPDRMKIENGAYGTPAAYIYGSGNSKVKFPVDQVTGQSSIFHSRLIDPINETLGQSPVEAAAFAVDQHNEAMRWLQALLQNSARPSGAFVIPADSTLSDEEFNRLKAEMDSQHQGGRNAGRPLLLEGGMSWTPFGLSPVDMEILRVKDSAARDISLAFGVPPLLLNIPGDNTYANYREARLGFYEDTVLPLIDYLLADFNTAIQPYFPNLEVRPNRDKIEAIADKRKRLWEMADASEDLTLNESRGLKGYDPLPEPIGSMLMSEVRRLGKEPAAVDAATLKELTYGDP